jgi:hypothetical protein
VRTADVEALTGWPYLDRVKGLRMVLLGGEVREERRVALEEAFQLESLEWIPRNRPRQVASLAERAARGRQRELGAPAVTILAGVRAKSFVVMAGDQRMIDGDGHAPAGRLGPSARELAVHPSIPLAVAHPFARCRVQLRVLASPAPASNTKILISPQCLATTGVAQSLCYRGVAHISPERVGECLTT